MSATVATSEQTLFLLKMRGPQTAQQLAVLLDVTSMGARRQPLLVAITTAGYDRESICWEQHEYARQVLSGVIVDPSFYALIAAADEADDWTAPETWRKANPGLGVSVKLEYLEQAL